MGTMGQAEEGLRLLAEALPWWTAGRGWYMRRSASAPGRAFLLRQAVPAAQAEACFQQALDVARRQQAKSWELRAARACAACGSSRASSAEAYELLAPVYGWFTEGFDTADLQEAKALLEALGG